ncbi:MAG: hypothetical protein JOZ07_11825 [Solirubrobacterales bacterium]|nr:hypothetical protein [Solirubrobacterales bacterium]
MSTGPDHHPALILDDPMKKILELLLCILHPVAVVLIWISLLGEEMGGVAKATWAVTSIVPLVPFIYVLTGHDLL